MYARQIANAAIRILENKERDVSRDQNWICSLAEVRK
jgi:hypothetical protein